ncbi:MAG: enoyl-CoA hydratase-related protein [Gammaproteobacteria bacterium]
MENTPAARLEIRGAVGVITLDRPEKRNALGLEVSAGLHAALLDVAADDNVRAVVLTGAGGAFSAGADLKEGLPEFHRVEDMINSRYRPSLELISSMDKPVIAAVAGPAAGIGMSFALCCDLVVMAESAFLLAPFSTIGLIPDGGATWFLARRLGYHRAYQLCVEAERIPAAVCLETGLANRVVADTELLEQAVGWAESLAQRAPLALAGTKQAMRQAMNLSLGETIALEARIQTSRARSDDCREGVAAFLARRKPEFKGR